LIIRNNSYIVIYMNNNDEFKIILQRFRELNLKITPQRTAILKEITGDKTHPAADRIFQKIHKKYPNISFDTVNRTLNSFSESGIIKVVEGYGNPKRYDPITDRHHHFQCLRCHTIIDFKNASFDKLRIPAAIRKKHSVLNQKVILEGICDKCKKKERG
jgi:Fur family peroxide stress response transcriptional regulator